ncbi:MAG TPA: metallophosphoesterase [Candidatus Deferrimicrobium sp.]|nr:metallophosphoesterase [Candidatus Deferrimicrobium sp.]
MPKPLESYITNLPLKASELLDFLEEMRKIFIKEPNLIKIQRGPCIFIGDTHGDLDASLEIIEKFLFKEDYTLVFLGDYVDRGVQQLENVLFLFLLKKDYPQKIILLRGNHEEEAMNISYGFRNILSQTFGKDSKRIFEQFQRTFAQLPLCILTWNHIFGVHGGIPIDPKTRNPIILKEIEQLSRGITHIEQLDFITAQLLWNDPKNELTGAEPSARGIGFYFGKEIFEDFITINNIQLVIRSHEVFQSGYKYFFDQKLISIFSALNYGFLQSIEAKIVKLDADGTIQLMKITE